jgi:hypothetical protein
MKGFSRRGFLLTWLGGLFAGTLAKPVQGVPPPPPVVPVAPPFQSGPMYSTYLGEGTTTFVYDATKLCVMPTDHVTTFCYDSRGSQGPTAST